MINTLVFWVAVVVVVWALSPRLFLCTDRFVARRNSAQMHQQIS